MVVDDQELRHLAGKFIVLDGPDGCGKTTQQALLAARLQAAGLSVVTCRDPGGTVIGDRIRAVLLDHDLSAMDTRCETLLFMASRAQLCTEVIRPALEAGKTVVCDRYVSATCAYQGAGGVEIAKVIELARLATNDLWPDVTVIIDIDIDEGFARIAQRNGAECGTGFQPVSSDTVVGRYGSGRGRRNGRDAMESRSRAFHQEVARVFKETQDHYPTPVVHADGHGEPEVVHERIVALLQSSCPSLT